MFGHRQLHIGRTLLCLLITELLSFHDQQASHYLEIVMQKKSIYKNKRYTHFDSKKDISAVLQLVENPCWVSQHGFYPFIHYDIKTIKYKNRERNEKSRKVYYAAHIDRYIYALYAHKINNLYNERAKRDCINKCAIAYRNCLGKNNIHFAKEAFDAITRMRECYVIIGDFTNFFDRLDHKFLKSRLKDLLNVHLLPSDYYSVYKNLTRFSYIDYDDLLKITELTRKEFGRLNRAMEIEKFHEIKKRNLHINPNSYGIPQGAAISAVLSNVYMLEFDKAINDYCSSLGALYRRYCDDFIVVIPSKSTSSLEDGLAKINSVISSTPLLELEPKKTQVFEVNHLSVENISNVLSPEVEIKNRFIAYLGFTFDGKEIQIRDKTIHKYYSRLYRKIETANKYSCMHRRNVFRKKLYEAYTHLGNRNPKNCKCLFLNYVDRAANIFGDITLKKKTKKHMRKISKRLKSYC